MRNLVLLAVAALAEAGRPCAAADADAGGASEVKVARFGLYEGVLAGVAAAVNPFAPHCNVTVAYVGAATSRHPAMAVGTFWSGDTYHFRFAPDALGPWQVCALLISGKSVDTACMALLQRYIKYNTNNGLDPDLAC
jgi:hypothetical protein